MPQSLTLTAPIVKLLLRLELSGVPAGSTPADWPAWSWSATARRRDCAQRQAQQDQGDPFAPGRPGRAQRLNRHRGDWPGPIFGTSTTKVTTSSTWVSEPMPSTSSSTRAARLPKSLLSPRRDLRGTFAGDLLDANVDIVTVQKLLGHSSPATTAGYNRRGTRPSQKAVKHIHVPYRGHTTKGRSTSHSTWHEATARRVLLTRPCHHREHGCSPTPP